MNTSYLTKKGLTDLKSELEQLTSVGRKECAEKIKAAIDTGGYEDNVVYEQELEKRDQLELRIAELEEILRSSTVIDQPSKKESLNFVSIGSVVVVESEGEVDTFKIVGSFEANPIKNLVSNESPVGQAIIGAKIGDVVEVTTPVVKLKYKILEIKYE